MCEPTVHSVALPVCLGSPSGLSSSHARLGRNRVTTSLQGHCTMAYKRAARYPCTLEPETHLKRYEHERTRAWAAGLPPSNGHSAPAFPWPPSCRLAMQGARVLLDNMLTSRRIEAASVADRTDRPRTSNGRRALRPSMRPAPSLLPANLPYPFPVACLLMLCGGGRAGGSRAGSRAWRLEDTSSAWCASWAGLQWELVEASTGSALMSPLPSQAGSRRARFQ